MSSSRTARTFLTVFLVLPFGLAAFESTTPTADLLVEPLKVIPGSAQATIHFRVINDPRVEVTTPPLHGNDECVPVKSLEEGTKWIYQTLVEVASK